MVLHTSPYPSACLHFLDGLSWILVFPCYWLLDRMLGSCVPTSLEKRRRSQEPCSFVALYVLVSAPLYLLAFLLALPFALLGFLLWAPIQAIRQPYVYTYHRPDKQLAEQGGTGLGGSGVGEWKPQGRSFCFCTANVCLLPDSLARFNNLSDTQRRAREVGKRIRNGASRPQIKIYIDSPTNTSISAASFSSLATGFRRTSSLGQRPDHTNTTETEPLTECPIHPAGAPDCPLHNTTGDQGSAECALHPDGADNAVDCPLHSEGDHEVSDCPVHITGELPDCPMHQSESSPGHHDPCPMHQSETSPGHHDPCPMHQSETSPGHHDPCPMHQSEAQSSPGHHDPCAMHHTGAQSSPGHHAPCAMHHTGAQSSPGHHAPCAMHHTGAHSSPGHHDPCAMHHTGAQSSPGHHAPCAMHHTGAQSSPGHHAPCAMHHTGAQSSPGHHAPCAMHHTGAQSSPGHYAPCPMHEEDAQANPSHDCPLHASGVQISISAPEPEPQEDEAEAGNHRDMAASRESLTRGDGARDVGGGMYSNNTLSHVPRTSVFKRPGRKRRHGDDGFDHEISAFFPANLDFLALQEVFDHASTSRLRRQLHRYFPYVLSDVGRYGWKGCCSRFKFLNSGLLLASRYPILDARYECYPNGRAEDALAAKGALFAKVHVGTSHQDQRVVGYITSTHLHAIEGDSSVRCEQLDLILQWGAEFRQSSCRSPEGEKVLEDLVAFDVLLGDLNFDNCSSEDKLEQQHALFTQYKDPCRLGPGEDKPWALGTLLDPSGLYDDEVNSPESLQKVMENEEGRKEYLVFPPSKGQCHGSVQKGRKIPLKGNGRRIDYILYSDEGLQPDWKLDIEEYSFVTQLAGLTDHLSVAARLAVSTGEDE